MGDTPRSSRGWRFNVRLLSSLGGLSLGVAITLSAAAAYADEELDEALKAYPVQYVMRPLTLTEFTLSPSITLDVTRFVKDSSGVSGALDTNLSLAAGAA